MSLASRPSDGHSLGYDNGRPPDLTEDGRGEGARAEELERVVRTLTRLLDTSQLAQRVTESVLSLFRAESSSVWLQQPDGSLACVARAGQGPESPKVGDVLPCDVGVVERVVGERRTLWAAAVIEAPGAVPAERRGHEAFGASQSTVLAVPLTVGGEIIGVLVTGYGHSRGLSQAEIDRAQAFADRITPAMRNVQRFVRAEAARATAEAASLAKDEALTLLAHEFRNSLAPIMTSAAVIRRAGPPDGIVPDSAAIVKRQAQHMARLLDDLLDVSRIAHGTMDLKREPVSVSAVVEAAVETTRSFVELRGLTVSLSLPPAPLWLRADRTRLEQVVGNLLSNAIKYTPAGGRIEVTAVAENGDAVLRIHDTGIGILPEHLPRVFDSFFRSAGAQAHTPNGLGLGLTLVRQFVELHGGRVAAHSEGPGRGSEFTVRLPLGPAAEPLAPVAVAGSKPRSTCSVLIIEDRADTREALRALLEHEGHRVDVASDGPSGLARDEATRSDVVLIDIGLPGLDGFEVATQIRARRGAEPLLVALTGYGRAEDRHRSFEAGFDAHLTKPVLSDDLMSVLGILGPRPSGGAAPRRAA
jgi:signal transduction histidine kinase